MAVGVEMDVSEENDPSVDDFREGSIVRVRMTDFITYDSVEFSPGNSLNIVIGPNGTGKSTILSAIVLGLGGKPVLLGKKDSNIQEFIKSNRKEAHIEIELLRRGRNSIIKRSIYSDGKSVWQINGRNCPLKDIEALTKSLNIQIDNLCQVLPQDRVQDFAKLNKEELLEATQKAVGKEGMADIHTRLKNLQKEQKILETQIAVEKKKKDVEQNHVTRLSGVVEKISQRASFEEEAENCRKKLSIVSYKAKRDEVERYKALKRETEEKVKRVEANLAPFKDKIRSAESNLNTKKNRRSGMDKKIRNQMNEVSNLRTKIESLRDDILELEVGQEKNLKSVEGQKKEEAKVKQQISKFQNDIASQKSLSASSEAKVQQLNSEVNKLAERLRFLEPAKIQIDNDVSDLKNELNAINHEISRLENMKGLRMRTLREVNSHAYQAAKWVDENRHLFEKPVYLPMVVELDVNPTYAKYVENCIGGADLIAITCESKNDMKIIIDNCRTRNKLSVNVLQVDSHCQRANPRISSATLRSHYPAFDGYLSDFVKGPEVLLNFLYHRKGFHNIPVSLRGIDGDVQNFTLFYSGDIRRNSIKSRYTSNIIHQSDPVPEARYFKMAGAQDRNSEELKLRASEIQNRIRDKENESSVKDREIGEIRAYRNEKREESRKLQGLQTNIQQLKFRLSQQEKILCQLERNRVDPNKVREEFQVNIKTAVLKLSSAQEPFFEALKTLDAYTVESQLLELEVQAAKVAVDSVKQLCRAEEEASMNVKRELEEVSHTLSEVSTQAKDLVRAMQVKYGKTPQQLYNENEQIFCTLPNTIEDLESHIEDKIAHAQMLSGGNDADQIRQYQGHVRQLASLVTSIEAKERQAATLVSTMEQTENEWKRDLNDLVGKISSNFSRYFSEMNCAGEVLLHTGNNEHDYDNYGLRVRVKFRNSEDLQDLNAFTQSGGERAVSTAIYMLALQELTPVPFRLVDEINQGMDSKNERRVYELLLRSTSRPGTPQYFLLTPKLLKNMEYNARTTVLCVMNSACAPNHKTWDIEKFISIRKQQGGNGAFYSNANNRVEDVDSE